MTEKRIVWLEDIERLDYVRASQTYLKTRNRRPTWRRRAGRLVGYSVLTSETRADYPGGWFRRRIFWLSPHDRDSEPTGEYGLGEAPAEAIDPRTLAPNVSGDRTDRVWHGSRATR